MLESVLLLSSQNVIKGKQPTVPRQGIAFTIIHLELSLLLSECLSMVTTPLLISGADYIRRFLLLLWSHILCCKTSDFAFPCMFSILVLKEKKKKIYELVIHLIWKSTRNNCGWKVGVIFLFYCFFFLNFPLIYVQRELWYVNIIMVFSKLGL